MTKCHELKVLPAFFTAVSQGTKTFELRKDDRGFEVGDRLRLREWDGEYSGRSINCKVTFILRDFPGLEPSYVILNILVEGGSQ